MKNLKIGNVELNGNVLLAPMAGFTNVAFRKLAILCGASLTYTEMVSAKALLYENKKTMDLLKISDIESPCACQIFGNDPEAMGRAVRLPVLQKFDIIDINMGCPAPKIIGNGEGSALLKNKDLARKIIEEVVNNTSKPVTVKFRIGFNNDEVVAVEFAKMCEEAGAKAITIHGRTTAQGYSGKADMQIIRECKKSVNIPVIANGDCLSREDYERMLEITGADGVMIGRGALGNPEIFSQIKKLDCEYTKKQLLIQYLQLMQHFLNPKQALLESRTHIMFFLKGIKNSASAKIKVMNATSFDELYEIIDEIFE